MIKGTCILFKFYLCNPFRPHTDLLYMLEADFKCSVITICSPPADSVWNGRWNETRKIVLHRRSAIARVINQQIWGQ